MLCSDGGGERKNGNRLRKETGGRGMGEGVCEKSILVNFVAADLFLTHFFKLLFLCLILKGPSSGLVI